MQSFLYLIYRRKYHFFKRDQVSNVILFELKVLLVIAVKHKTNLIIKSWTQIISSYSIENMFSFGHALWDSMGYSTC